VTKTIVNYRGIEIEMEAIPRAEIGIDELICDSRYPYNENCESFPDPRELLGIKGVDFSDFCEELNEYIVPAEKLIENCHHKRKGKIIPFFFQAIKNSEFEPELNPSSLFSFALFLS
jgi:hypothetical protein